MASVLFKDKNTYVSFLVVAARKPDRECFQLNSDPTLPPASIGQFNSTGIGYGVKLTKTMSKAFGVFADDGGAALAAGAAVRALQGRLLLGHAGASVDASAYGGQLQCRVKADISGYTGIIGGAWNYLEFVSGGKVNVGGACVAQVDLPSGAYAVAHVAGVLIKSNDLGGTHTGIVAGIYCPNPGAGVWDAFADLGPATGMTQDAAAGSNPGKFVKLYINGVLSTIATAIA